MKFSPKAALSGLLKRSADHWFLRGGESGGSGGGTSVSNPYSESSWVFSALNFISSPIKRSNLEFFEGAERDPVKSDLLHSFWKDPARSAHEDIDLSTVIDLLVMMRGVQGTAFLILDDSWLGTNPATFQKLIIAGKRQMTPILDGGTLDGWMYRGANGSARAYDRLQVINLKRVNPNDVDSLDGIPPWMSVKDAAESNVAASRYAKRTMDLNGDKGSWLIMKGGAPSKEQKEAMRAELRERRRAQEEGRTRDSIIGGDVEVSSPTLKSVTSDFSAQVAGSREEIFVAYGVPPSMATQSASYSVGSASDWYRLISDTCMGESESIGRAFSRISDYLMGYRSLASEIQGAGNAGRGETKRIEALFNFDNHPVMSDVRIERTETATKLWSVGMPMKVASEFLGLGIPEYEGWEQGFLPYNVGAVTGAEDPTPQKAAETAPAEKSFQEITELTRKWSATRGAKKAKSEADDRLARWKKIDRARTGARNRMNKAFTKQLFRARVETLRLIAAEAAKGEAKAVIVTKAGVIDLVFNLATWASDLWKTLGAITADIFVEAAADADDEVPGEFDPMKTTDPRVIEHVRSRENLIKGAADEVHQQILESLEEGIASGETFDELSARVKAEFNGISKVRADMIARTETGAAYETARYTRFKDAGITRKSWLSGGDDGVTRATHMAADAQVVGIDEFFVVGEAKLLHPADHIHGAGHPEETVNCRCVVVAEPD